MTKAQRIEKIEVIQNKHKSEIEQLVQKMSRAKDNKELILKSLEYHWNNKSVFNTLDREKILF